MEKDFDSWNHEKKKLEKTGHERLVFHEREIWWCSVGINLGHEQDGKNEYFERPVLVIRKFNNRIAWVLPITSKAKTGQYYFSFTNNGKDYATIVSQLRLLSVKRFRRYIRKVSPSQFALICQKIINLFPK